MTTAVTAAPRPMFRTAAARRKKQMIEVYGSIVPTSRAVFLRPPFRLRQSRSGLQQFMDA
jgi:hypothetical protein